MVYLCKMMWKIRTSGSSTSITLLLNSAVFPLSNQTCLITGGKDTKERLCIMFFAVSFTNENYEKMNFVTWKQ